MMGQKNKFTVASTIALLSAFGAAAYAQEAPPPPVEEDEIIVTGSNIRGASDSGAIAVTIVDSEQIETLGQSSTGEILENLAQAGTFEINSAADGPNDARGDVSTVNLRGLGTGNTLVLLNGRRLAAHAANQDIGSTPRQIVNVNAFPSSGIDRIEVLRDGASALYGADATAGVVNTILAADFTNTRFSWRESLLEDTDHTDRTFDLASGFEFNQGNTRVILVGSYYERNGLYASELDGQFNSVDKRGYLGDNPYATDTTDFRNTSTSSPFGQFQAGDIVDGVFVGQRVRQGTTALTNTTGVFHIQPCGFAGTRATLYTFTEGCMGLDDGNLDTALRYDFNANQPNNSLGEGVNIANDAVTSLGRQLISEATRYNFYSLVEHDFNNNLQAFGEALYYSSVTDSNRATQPLDSGLAFLIVPASNYWNPFGPITSPNRLAGLNPADVPNEGLDVLLQNWRPTDLGPRFISTESTTFRVLGGLRGQFGNWDWETAIAYSENETSDTESNRLSKTLLQAELSLSTPDAINPFGGPNANTQAQWDRVRISNTNTGMTSLTTWDARASNSDAFSTWAGPVGVAFGAEWRNESYEEDRDPRLDGTIIFSTDNVSGTSDVVGVSPTADSSAERNVFSVFGETLIPLNRGTGMFPNDITLQLAVRGEYFEDLDDGAIKPKVAISWFPLSNLNLRAAYSQGFRVPNLVQLNRGDVSRLNLGNDDYWRAPVTGDPVSNGDAYLASVRQSNPNLENEDTETIVIGAVWDVGHALNQSWLTSLRFSVDYWRFEQEGVIGAFGDQEALALDFLLRRDGSSNPNVVRAAVTATDQAAFDAWNLANPTDQRVAAGQVLYIIDPYINLDSQTADGYDFGMAAGVDAGMFGEFDLNLEVTHLQTLDVVRNDLLNALANDPSFGGDFTELQVDRIQVDGNPEWRATASLRWRLGPWGAGASLRYVSGFDDTGADLDLNTDGIPEYWRVNDYYRFNLFGDYRFDPSIMDSLRLRVGVNNVFDEAPPLVDESLGYRSDYHSLKGREFYLQIRSTF
jgi:iron complex outermembrane receptor protein